MSTPRTIKASEVVKGMRVEAEREFPDGKVSVSGRVAGVSTDECGVYIHWDNGSNMHVNPYHPVTVLAEPEPEWVEGAWYWIEFNGSHRRPMYRDAGMWSAFTGGTGMRYDDDEVTVLGRVLIVDWPGDDVARELKDWPANNALMTAIDDAAAKVADAIRTQGGAR